MPSFSAGTLRFEARQEGPKWSFVSEKIDSEDDVEIARLALEDTLPKLCFELVDGVDAKTAVTSTLSVPVIAPVRRYWAGSSLASADILDATARLELRTTKRPPDVHWIQNGFVGEVRAVVGQPTTPIELQDGVIARRSSTPVIQVQFDQLSWEEQAEELAISGSLSFDDLPIFPPDVGGKVVVDSGTDEFPVTFRAEERRFQTTVRIGSDRPRTIRLRFVWDARWDQGPLTTECDLDLPVAFDQPDFRTEEGTFATSIFLGLPPKAVRFAKHEYLPNEIVLNFTFRTHIWQCRAVHTTGTVRPAVYEIDWVGEAFETFKRAAPGSILMSVAGESKPARHVLLLPGLVRGVWTYRDGKAAFRLTSAGIDEREIVGLSAASNGQKVGVSVKDGTIVPRKEISSTSHVVFRDDAVVPLDPGGFKPLYLNDPGILWKHRERATLVGAEPDAPELASTLLRGNTASPLESDVSLTTIPLARLRELGSSPAILQFGDVAYQMLLAPPSGVKFGAPLGPGAFSEGGAAGLYFRGFYFSVSLIDANGPLAPGGKVLLLSTPLSLAFPVMRDHLLAFSPLRAAFDPKKGVLTILEGGKAIPLTVDDSGIIGAAPGVFGRLGYLYGSRTSAQWSPAAAKDALPWLYTFDNLAFGLTANDEVTFAGWFLPNGSAVFPAQTPFPAYGFDFSAAGAIATAVLEPLPLRIGTWESRPAVDAASLAEFEAGVAERLEEIGVGTSFQQLATQFFSIDTADRRRYDLSIELDPATQSLRLIVQPPASSPAVRFFSLT